MPGWPPPRLPPSNLPPGAGGPPPGRMSCCVEKSSICAADEDDDGESEIDTTVIAPLYPLKKQECVAALFLFLTSDRAYWVVLSEPSTRTLLAIKKVRRTHVGAR